jgi:hypothetical protein
VGIARVFDRYQDPKPFWGARGARITQALFAALAVIGLGLITHRVRMKKPPRVIPMGQDGDAQRFGLSLEKRKAMFADVAGHDVEWRTKAASRFSEAWRREDDRAAMERDHVRSMAGRHRVNVSIVYLVVDEGLRLKWTGPNGVPLNAAVVPLQQK